MLEPARDAGTAGITVRHLARGAIGFGLVALAVVLTPSVGPGALLLALPGMVALRGCPICWIAGLIQIVSAGRLQRTCSECAPPKRIPRQ
jgi:hypothetical protein